ncbi:MAG: hypothetical protein INR73_22260 [Williamsia sp.]|nr:hypothetical protein [Williamsia sp.]
MIPSVRREYNSQFTEEKYQAYLRDLNGPHPGAIEFRVAETPVFVPKDFTRKIIDTCERIVDVIVDPKFKEMTDRAIPADVYVPNENGHSHFIAFDFGVCENERGELEPQLIEMQGFPTLFAFQVYQPEVIRRHFPIPENFDAYLGGFNKETYLELLRKIVLGNHAPENVILLEILPHQQKTRIDFYCTQDYLHIKPVCITELIQEGRKLYYDNEGKKTEVKRIYNRVIFDDLQQQSEEIQQKGKVLLEDLAVEWAPHPNWFYRISKYTLPFVKHPNVPETFFLNELKQPPADLENYVLKPLFSFAGQGVIIDLVAADLEKVKDPENWILQRKVKYADVIPTPDIPAKAEFRIFYFWEDGAPRPVPTNNLARLSKGKMIGVRYNKDKEWVGGTVCFFEK